jgi:hypothetical protein
MAGFMCLAALLLPPSGLQAAGIAIEGEGARAAVRDPWNIGIELIAAPLQ